jgi:hypothetical protein
VFAEMAAAMGAIPPDDPAAVIREARTTLALVGEVSWWYAHRGPFTSRPTYRQAAEAARSGSAALDFAPAARHAAAPLRCWTLPERGLSQVVAVAASLATLGATIRQELMKVSDRPDLDLDDRIRARYAAEAAADLWGAYAILSAFGA